MKIENVAINLIIPYKENTKKHDKKQIKQVADSIKRFGFVQSLVIDKDNNLIIGHCRLLAAKLLDLKEVPVIKAESLTKEEVKALRLTDNKLNESPWEMNLVVDELKGLSDELVDLTGFDRDLLIEPDEKDDVVPESAPSISKLGDLYELGRHRVLCGDSTKREDVERLMNGLGKLIQKVVIITDPPYGINLDTDYSDMEGWHKSKKYKKVIGDKKQFNYRDFEYLNADEEFWWGADYYTDTLPNYGKDGSWFVWDKRVDESKDKMFGSGFEMLWSKVKHQRRLLRVMWAGFMGSVEASKRVHPTQKPTKVIMEIIKEYTKSKDIILDLFLGSGTILIACEKTNRICYGMELDEHYCDVIVQRYVDYTDNENIKKNGKEIIWKKSEKNLVRS